ncbi:hypothetical protein ACWDAO_40725 [Streptomyces sp. NPDC001212]
MDLKQVQAGIAAGADGGIPVHAKVFDDGAAEVSQIIGAMRDLRQLVGERELLMVADSKLVSYTNISALLKSKVSFIAPVPAAQISDGFYARDIWASLPRTCRSTRRRSVRRSRARSRQQQSVAVAGRRPFMRAAAFSADRRVGGTAGQQVPQHGVEPDDDAGSFVDQVVVALGHQPQDRRLVFRLDLAQVVPEEATTSPSMNAARHSRTS